MRLRLLMVLIAAASVVSAQRGGGGGGRGGGGNVNNIPVGGPVVKNRLDQITDLLKLSKDQKKQIKSLMDDAQKEAAPLKDQLSKSRGQVAQAVGGGKADEIDNAVKSHAELETKMTAIEMKAFVGIYKLLDPDQRDQRTATVLQMMPGVFKGKNWVDAE